MPCCLASSWMAPDLHQVADGASGAHNPRPGSTGGGHRRSAVDPEPPVRAELVVPGGQIIASPAVAPVPHASSPPGQTDQSLRIRRSVRAGRRSPIALGQPVLGCGRLLVALLGELPLPTLIEPDEIEVLGGDQPLVIEAPRP